MISIAITKKKQINTFEYERKKINFENNEKEMEQHSSNMESNELDEECSKNISMDTPSNKINSLNVYTFNTKFCDFNNQKSRKTGKLKEIGFIKKNKRLKYQKKLKNQSQYLNRKLMNQNQKKKKQIKNQKK